MDVAAVWRTVLELVPMPGSADVDRGGGTNDGGSAGTGSGDDNADDRGSSCGIKDREEECAGTDTVAHGRACGADDDALPDSVAGVGADARNREWWL